jgi:alpha-amylase
LQTFSTSSVFQYDWAMKRLIHYLLMTFLLTSALALAQDAGQARAFNEGVYYEIFVRSFQDSDGDGNGDFRGIIQRLDYLLDLGISGIWLMPIHPSPSYHGYDVTDYVDVNPDYGTLQDFEALLEEAHARGIKVIIDLVVNHTSNKHPWFISSQGKKEPYRDYYLWATENPGWRSFNNNAAWHRTVGGYYLGLFWIGMPDLNYRNPAVVAEMNEVARFWLELGIDGFRIDAIQHVVESEAGEIRNSAENLDWVKQFEAAIKSVRPDAFIVGETWTDAATIARYHQEAGLDMSFNFPLMDSLLGSVRSGSASELRLALKQDSQLYPPGANSAIFLTNHDLERPASSLNPFGAESSKLATALLFSLPGTPFIYYGEEIGMPNGAGREDEAKRSPMRWDETDGAGFSSASPWRGFSTLDPSISVAAQEAAEGSVLNGYKSLIALRRANPALARGLIELEAAQSRGLLAFWRKSPEQTILVLANLGKESLSIDLSDYDLAEARDLITGELVSGRLELASQSLYWLEAYKAIQD